MTRKNSTAQQTMMPNLMAVQQTNGGWAVVSDDKRRPLTQGEAFRVIAAYLALYEL